MPGGINYEILNAEIAERHRSEELRDRFAMAAVTGLLAALAHPDSVGPDNFRSEVVAVDAFEIADQMMAFRGSRSNSTGAA